jgi:hypothetical protein
MRVSGAGREPGQQEKELAGFLNGQEQLRGRVHLIAERRQTGGMGQSIGSIVVELGPTGLAVFASALIGWIRHKTADTRITVHRQDGTKFEISAQRVRGLGAAEVSTLVEQIAGAVSGEPAKMNAMSTTAKLVV